MAEASLEERISQDMRVFSAQSGRHPDRPWGFLPPFANDANRQAHASILDLEATLAQLDEELAENVESANVLNVHLEKTKREIQYTNAKLTAKMRESAAESHLMKLAERETERLERERQKAREEQSVLEQTLHQLQLAIFKSNEELQSFKLQMHFDTEEMQKWIAEREKREEDQRVLEKYRRQDEALVKDLDLRIQNLNKQTLGIRDSLRSEVTDSQAAQMELEKAAEDFRTLHSERVRLVERWDETVAAIRKRDQRVEAATAKLKELQTLVQDREAAEKDATAALEAQLQTNRKLDVELQSANRELDLTREALRKADRSTHAGRNDLALAQYACKKARRDLAQQTAANSTSQAQLRALRASVASAEAKFQSSKAQIQEERRRLEDVSLHDDALRERLETEAAQLRETEKNLTLLKQEQFKKGQRLSDVKRQEADLVSHISGVAAQDRNLRSKIATIDEQLLRQEEILYNVEFKVVMMERKVERLRGVRSHDEEAELNKAIAGLSRELEDVNGEHAMLMAQLKRAQHYLQQARRQNGRHVEAKERVERGVAEMELEAAMLQRDLLQRREEKENLMVDQDVLHLEIQRLRQCLTTRSTEVTQLQEKKRMLQHSIRQKKQELLSQQDCLRYELKNVRDEMHRVRVELSERKQRAATLKMKYDTTASKKLSADGEAPEYCLIRAAQEKEDLKREAEKLTIDVQRATTEAKGLENALEGLHVCNLSYKASMSREEGSALWTLQTELKAEMDRSYDTLKARRAEEAQLLEDNRAAEATQQELQIAANKLTTSIDSATEHLLEAERQYREQREKESRARSQAKRLSADVAASGAAVQCQMVRLSVLQDVNRSILLDLKRASLTKGCPVATEVLAELQALGIPLPNAASNRSTPRSTRPSSKQSRPTSSSASSINSVSIKTLNLEF